jgi:hypothetical protein
MFARELLYWCSETKPLGSRALTPLILNSVESIVPRPQGFNVAGELRSKSKPTRKLPL